MLFVAMYIHGSASNDASSVLVQVVDDVDL